MVSLIFTHFLQTKVNLPGQNSATVVKTLTVVCVVFFFPSMSFLIHPNQHPQHAFRDGLSQRQDTC